MTDATKLIELLRTASVKGGMCDIAADLIEQQAARIAELEADCAELEHDVKRHIFNHAADLAELTKDAERYRVLRVYEIYSMGWPFENIDAPGGLLAASCRHDEWNVMTQANLDRMLDELLGLIPSADKRVRPDYQEWRASETRKRIDAALAASEPKKD